MRLTNATGIDIEIIPIGASILALRTPDRTGRIDDIVLGYATVDAYRSGTAYFGAVVGRYANRIARGRFTLDGRTYELATNDGSNHLHGGLRGFDKVEWTEESFSAGGGDGVRLTYTSPDGDEGYPGTVHARVTYVLTAQNDLVIEYEATTDRATPVNLTQHSYFNLAGEGRGGILDHVLAIDANHYVPVDATSIPLGQLSPVDGTPFDFRQPRAVGDRIEADDVQLRNTGGYDHCFALGTSGVLRHAARVVEPISGRTLDVATTEPGVQFYSGNFLDGTIIGKNGHVYAPRTGFCLETQHFPDSPNQPQFPSTILRPGERYTSKTVFAFGIARLPLG